MYTPVGIVGYFTYGDSLHDSVINSIQTQGIQQAINLLITIHCILTLTIVFSPLNQDMEEIFKVPQSDLFFPTLMISIFRIRSEKSAR